MSPRLPALLFVTAVFAASCSDDPEVAKRKFVESGDAYAAAKRYPEAIVQYRNAVQQDPRFGQGRSKLGAAYVQTGDFANAYREYIRAADLLPEDADVQVKAGEMLLAARQFDEAKVRAEKALARNARHVDAQILRANSLSGLNKIDDAIAEIEQAIRNAPDRSSSYASLGAMQLVRGSRAEAEAAFRKAIEVDGKSARPHLALANFLWATNRAQEAEAELKAAIALEPDDLLTNRTMAYLYMGTGRAAAAEPHLKILADRSPGGDGKLILADYYISVQRPAEAKSLLERVAADHKENFSEATLRLASISVAAGDSVGAERLLTQVLEKAPAHVEALIAKAQLRMNAGRLDEASAELKSAFAADSRSANVHFALGKLHAFRRESDAAMAAFTQALQIDPRMAGAEVELAKLHLAAGRINDAEHFASSAVAKISRYAEAHLVLARTSLVKGNLAKATDSLEALKRSFPDSPTIQTELGLLALAKKDPVEARAAFERALAKDRHYVPALAELTQMDLNAKQGAAAKARIEAAVNGSPNDARLHVIASQTYAAVAEPASAERSLRRAIEVDPSNLEAYTLLGNLYASQQRLPEATAQFEQIIVRHPANVSAHTFAGILYQMQNRSADARRRYQAALEVDKRAAIAANNLAWMHAEEGGNLDVALGLAQTAKSQMPDQPEVNDTLAWVYHKKGLSSLAIAPLLQSLEKDPKNVTYHYHLGVVYGATGNAPKARESLNRVLALQPESAEAAQAKKALQSLKG